jgi:hypothetical protein
MRTIAPWFTAFMAASLGFSAGCALDPPDFPSQEELYGPFEYPGFYVSMSQRTLYTAQIHDSGILGPDVNLGRYNDPDDRAMRGFVFEQHVQLKTQDARAYGVVNGTLPVDLVSHREDGAVRIQGLIRGYPADFRFDKERISGTVGRCRYELAAPSGTHRYDGTLACIGHVSPVRVNVPAELFRWSDVEQGAALSLLLGG